MSTLALGVVGNRTAAGLIDRRGRPVWHGLGRLDGDPLFNAPLGGDEPEGGYMEAAVAGAKEGRHPKTGELRSNLPETCSQVGPTLSAMRLSRTWEEDLWHAS